MGLFCLPAKTTEDMTPADYVDCAEANLRLWRDHPDATYLLDMASGMLKRAAGKDPADATPQADRQPDRTAVASAAELMETLREAATFIAGYFEHEATPPGAEALLHKLRSAAGERTANTSLVAQPVGLDTNIDNQNPYGYVAEARDGHVTFFKDRPSAFDNVQWHGLMKVVELYTRPAAFGKGDMVDSAVAGATAENPKDLGEPTMLWDANDPEDGTQGDNPQDFAQNYVCASGIIGEVDVDVLCAYRGGKRTLRIVSPDEGAITWSWVEIQPSGGTNKHAKVHSHD